MAALFMIITAAVRLWSGGGGEPPDGTVSAGDIGERRELTVIGQVYQKDGLTFYLRDVSVREQISDISEEPQLSGMDSGAGLSRQYISCNDNIICVFDDKAYAPLGCYIRVKGRFAPFMPASNPGEFDAAAYYSTQGLGGRLTRAELLEAGEDFWPVREWISGLRLKLEQRLYGALPESSAGILCALLLGDRAGLDESVEDLYRRNGILHILSISSLHITVLGMSLYRLLRRLRLPVWASSAAGSALMVFYGFLTGFSVSARRAIGMYLIRMLGQILGRTYDRLTALGVTGAAMVWTNPRYLQQSGFLLSFSSVLGVCLLCPAIEASYVGKNTAPLGVTPFKRAVRTAFRAIGESAAGSLSVTLATLPVQLWFYFEAPVYAVFLNLLVLPLVKPLMLAGFLVIALPWFFPARAAAEGILAWYGLLCTGFARLPFGVWNPGRPQIWQIVLFLTILVFCAAVLNAAKDKKGRRVMCAKAACAAAIVIAVPVMGAHVKGEAFAAFLDVGQGDCIFVRTDSGENYLFDCGSSSRSGVGEYVLIPFLKYYGIHRLDAVFVSHPDEDHMNGVVELLALGDENGISVNGLILPDVARNRRNELFGELLKAAGETDCTTVRYIGAGDVWEVKNARFTCLNPAEGADISESNAYSECFLAQFYPGGEEKNGITLLLTGDVEGEGERMLIKKLKETGAGCVDILKVAHHGSRGSTSEELLRLIRPKVAVISCGRENRYGHPHSELIDRLEDCGSRIVVTKDSGAVWFRISAKWVRMGMFYPKYQDAREKL